MKRLLIEQLTDELNEILHENKILKIENEELKKQVQSHHEMVETLNASANKLIGDIIVGGFF